MKTNPILDELWKVKDQLAAEADHDAGRFLENLRRWEAENPHPGRIVRDAEELHQFLLEHESKQAAAGGLALKEETPRKN